MASVIHGMLASGEPELARTLPRAAPAGDPPGRFVAVAGKLGLLPWPRLSIWPTASY